MITEYEYRYMTITHALEIMIAILTQSRGDCVLTCGWNANIKRWVVCSNWEVWL